MLETNDPADLSGAGTAENGNPLAFRGALAHCIGMSTVAEISEAIEKLPVKEQFALLQALPSHLKIPPEEIAWAKVAESAFDFWDNPEDAVYDTL